MSHQRTNSNLTALISLTCFGMLTGCTEALEPELDEPAPLVDSLDRPLGPITREIVAANVAVDEQLNLIARVEIQDHELLEIYEPRPGLMIIAGAGAPTGTPMVDATALQGQSVAEIWVTLTNDAPMPAALEDALLRSPDVAVDFGSSLAGERSVAQRPSAAGGWCDTGFFSSAVSACETALSEPDVQVCLDDWFNGAFAQVDDGYWTTSTVCPAQGSVLMQLQSDEVVGGSWSVAQDTYRNVVVRDAACLTFWDDCPWVRVDIKDASGDRFHFRFVSDVE